jgi:hypothetical protein
MTAHAPDSVPSGRRSRRGQSLVEFALVLPMLLVLLLGIADFGRVFAAGITLEASARNAAETAAQEFLQVRRQGVPLTGADFDRIHAAAQSSVCEEAHRLPNTVGSGGTCSMPVAAVCIHDSSLELSDYGSRCGQGASAAPEECTLLHDAWPATEPATDQLPWVEVRVCYRFTTLFNLQDLQLPFGWGLTLGDMWLQRDRSFTVADY